MGYLSEDAPFYWENSGGVWWSPFIYVHNYAGWSLILWSMLYLEGWSSRSSYFIGVALPL